MCQEANRKAHMPARPLRPQGNVMKPPPLSGQPGPHARPLPNWPHAALCPPPLCPWARPDLHGEHRGLAV